MRLLTVQSVIDQMGLIVTSTIQEQVRVSILMATSHLESYLKTTFPAGTQVDYFYMDPQDLPRSKINQRLHLSKGFVRSIPAIEMGSTTDDLAGLPANALVHYEKGEIVLTRGPVCGYKVVSYSYGFDVIVDPAPEGKGDQIPADPEAIPEGLLAAAMMLSMMYFRMAGECAGDGDCYLKNFGRAVSLITAYDRRASAGFQPL